MVLVIQIVVVILLRPLFVLLYRPCIDGGGLVSNEFDRPVLFVANHSSYVDAFLTVLLPLRVFRKVLPVYYPTASLYMSKWYYRWILTPIGAYTIHRWSASLEEYMKQTIEHVVQNRTVLLFPEGKRVLDGSRPSGRSGIGLLRNASKDLHIIPIRIKFIKTKFWPFPKLHMTVGSEIQTRVEGSTQDDYRIFTNKILDEIYSL